MLNVPMKQRLELMSSIGTDSVNTKGKLLNHIVNEIYGILLSMARVDLQSPNPGSVVNGGILKATDLLAISPLYCQESHVDLDMMARNPFGITFGVDGSASSVSW